jgi:predicted anti-sigma-YlaC factor YlaD
MTAKHVIKYFIKWSEQKNTPYTRAMIEHHLKDCEECQKYYLFMGNVFKGAKNELLPKLEYEPYLPTKIRALAQKKSTKSGNIYHNRIPTIRKISFGLLLIFAILMGVFFGKWMSPSINDGDTELIYSYSNMFSNDNSWTSVENLFNED